MHEGTYAWAIMASKSMDYPYLLDGFRTNYNAFHSMSNGAPLGKVHWRHVPVIIKKGYYDNSKVFDVIYVVGLFKARTGHRS